jgi:hypothetical protein
MEGSVYAAIRQAKARSGTAEELARRIKEGAIPIISDVEGFMAYYVVYAPDDTVTAISVFNNHAGAEESNRRALAWIEESLAPLLAGPATATAGPVIVHTLA